MGNWCTSRSDSKPEVVSAAQLYDPETYQYMQNLLRREQQAQTGVYEPYGGAYGAASKPSYESALGSLKIFDPTVPGYARDVTEEWKRAIGEIAPGWMGKGSPAEIENILASSRASAERFYGEARGKGALEARKGGYAGGSAQMLETDIGRANLAGSIGEFESALRYEDVAKRRELETKFLQTKMSALAQGYATAIHEAEQRGESEVSKRLEAQKAYVEALYKLTELDEREIDRMIDEYSRAQNLTQKDRIEMTQLIKQERIALLQLLRGEVGTSSRSREAILNIGLTGVATAGGGAD